MEVIGKSYEDDKQLMAQVLVDPSGASDATMTQGLLRYKRGIWVGSKTNVRQQLAHHIHESGLGGHSGVSATLHRIKVVFYWPNVCSDVHKIELACDICQMCKDEKVPYPGLLMPLPIPK